MQTQGTHRIAHAASATHRGAAYRRFLRAACAAVVAVAAAGLLTAARSPSLCFTKPVLLAEAALQAKVMSGAVSRPMPPPTLHTYARQQGDQTSLIDLYDPQEIWQRTQHIGQWSDEYANTLSIAEMTSLIPDALRGKDAPREAIMERLDQPADRPNRWTTELVRQWVSDYTAAGDVTVTDLARPPRRFAEAMSFELPGRSAVGYACRFDTRYTGLGGAPDTWYMVLLQYNPAIPKATAFEGLLTGFLPAFAPARGTSLSPSDRLSKFMQNRDYKTDANATSGLQASRAQAAESIRNLKGWWFVNTDNYVFLANLDSRHGSMVRELQEDLEVLREAYEALIPPISPIDAVSIVRLFTTPEEYEAYVPAGQQWTAGMWMAARGELVIRPPSDARGQQSHREEVLRIAYHESFHQYLHYAMGRRQAAAWFNEGHATLFEGAEVRRMRTPSIGEDKRKAQRLEQLANAGRLRAIPLMRMSYEQFYAGDDPTRRDNYATAWGLVYFLRKAAPVDLGKRYVGIADAYIQSLKKQGDGSTATDEAFQGVDMERFEEDFASFWTSSHRRNAARRNRLFSF